MTVAQAFELAVQHHQAGRLAAAEAFYRQILAVEPRHAGALNLLGVIAHQVGHHEVAVDLIRQAIALTSGAADFHSNLGMALYGHGQLDEAIAACRQAIALQPNSPEACNTLGNALQHQGQLDEAVTAYRQAIAVRPDYAEAHSNLGNVLRDSGQPEEAIAAYRRAVTLKPAYAEAHNNLGGALREKGQVDEAIAAFKQAIAIRPDYAEAYNDLGTVLRDNGQLEEAITAYHQAIALKPDVPEAHNNLGNALRDKSQLDEAIAACHQAIALRPNYSGAYNNLGAALREKGQLDEAFTAFEHAIAINPDYAEAYSNLGAALQDVGKLQEAIAVYRRVIALRSDLPEAHNNLGSSLLDMGQLDEAMAAYRQAIALQPDWPEAHSNLALALHYHPDVDARVIAEEHRRWDRQHAEPLRQFIRAQANVRDPERRLRVGYVSPDFRAHPVAFFVENLLAGHDPGQVEVFCYSNLARPDAVTARLQRLAAHWREIYRRPDAEVADLIRHDQIDILVDLAGHTAGNRLPLFARKPAPVQVTWLGYPDSTGLEAIDYRLTDALADPPGATEYLHCEQLLRLPHCAWCFRPSAEAPPVNALPGLETGHITFGCFNALPKITIPHLRLWAEILRAVPNSHLLLKNRSLGDPATRERLQTLFAETGLAEERIELAAHAPRLAGHLGFYHRVDIALDTFPYHGTTTTCEALWMGVPVVTLAGKTHASRVGVSLLSNAGLPELIAQSEEQYREIAITLAGDLAHLAQCRATQRERMQNSPLLDATSFTRHLEAAYRAMWRRWCLEHKPALP